MENLNVKPVLIFEKKAFDNSRVCSVCHHRIFKSEYYVAVCYSHFLIRVWCMKCWANHKHLFSDIEKINIPYHVTRFCEDYERKAHKNVYEGDE